MNSKPLKFEYHIPRSRRPNWLLMFVAQAKATFTEEHNQSDQGSILSRLSSLLDKQVYERRKMQCSGASIAREIINDSRMIVYSDTGKTPFLEITFQNIEQ